MRDFSGETATYLLSIRDRRDRIGFTILKMSRSRSRCIQRHSRPVLLSSVKRIYCINILFCMVPSLIYEDT